MNLFWLCIGVVNGIAIFLISLLFGDRQPLAFFILFLIYIIILFNFL